jgi:hypothetical protein
MANGDIPVSGSADEGGFFLIKATPRMGQEQPEATLNVNTNRDLLHIFVNNGANKVFNEDLEPGWRLEIRKR